MHVYATSGNNTVWQLAMYEINNVAIMWQQHSNSIIYLVIVSQVTLARMLAVCVYIVIISESVYVSTLVM